MKRGHSAWIVFALSFLNFVVLQYRLVIESSPSLFSLFPHLLQFIIVFAVIYVPVTTLIGWIDYKRGSVPIESSVAVLSSPWFCDMALALSLMCDGKNEEAKKILQKWTGQL